MGPRVPVAPSWSGTHLSVMCGPQTQVRYQQGGPEQQAATQGRRGGAGPSKKTKTRPLFASDLDSGASPTPLTQPPLTPLQWGEPIVPLMSSKGLMVELVGALNDLQMRLVLLNTTLVEQAERDLRRMAAWDRMTQAMELLRRQMASTQAVWAGLMLVWHQWVAEGEE